MGDNSKIEWTDATWSPATGCDRVSPGCDHCYALILAKRLKAMGAAKYQADGDPRTSGPGFGVAIHPDTLDLPLSWRKPRRIFVNSMSDLFHDNVPDEFIARVWQVMARTPQHTYQILTKRHARMRAWVNRCKVSPGGWITHDGTDPAGACDGTGFIVGYPKPDREYAYRGPRGGKRFTPRPPAYGWPLPNVWLGVSVESQQWADIRIPALLDTPAAVRWLSCEPLLGPVDLSKWLGPVNFPPCWDDHEPSAECSRCIQPEWVVVGGESGPGARPMHPDWARSLRDQCQTARVPFFFKQLGEWVPVGPLYAQGDTEADHDEVDEAHMDAVGWEVERHKPVVQLESTGHIADGHQPTDPRTWLMARVGKKTAGRELDGCTWDEYPTTTAVT